MRTHHFGRRLFSGLRAGAVGAGLLALGACSPMLSLGSDRSNSNLDLTSLPDTDAGQGDSGQADSGTAVLSCFDAWKSPAARVTATSRPSPASATALNIDFSYQAPAGAAAELVLTRLAGTGIAQPSEGPFSPTTNSGTWYELRDASDQVLYTHTQYELVPENREGFTNDGGFVNIPYCPTSGSFRLNNLPNLAGATQLVLFQEAVDGKQTFKTIELARFTLP